MQGVIELAGQGLGREVGIGGGEQVGATDVPDEQRVAGENSVRNTVVGALVHGDADRLRSVSRRRHDLQRDLAEGEPLPVRQRLDGKLDRCAGAVGDHRAGAGRQLEVAAQKVGVDVCLDHPLDGQPVGSRLVEVVADVPSRVDDDGSSGGLVTDEVRGVRQARQVVLGEDHLPRAAPRSGRFVDDDRRDHSEHAVRRFHVVEDMAVPDPCPG